MKPVLILQHLSNDGPAYLATWLKRQGVRFEVFNTEAGQAFPADLAAFGALAILGGEMSANDALPSLRQAERLFLQALGTGTPTLGHCLGGQLMARALGAAVTRAEQPEIGWHRLRVAAVPAAAQWFGAVQECTVFEWHADTFALPPGAVPVASSAACAQQAFALGPHLAMQFHIEADEDKLRRWVLDADPRHDNAPAAAGGVQGPATMLAGLATHLPAQQALADHVYRRWLASASVG